MSYVVVYEKNGKRESQSFSSYYECVTTKERLRGKGYNPKIKVTGSDWNPTNVRRWKLNATSKAMINRFVNQECNMKNHYKSIKEM